MLKYEEADYLFTYNPETGILTRKNVRHPAISTEAQLVGA